MKLIVGLGNPGKEYSMTRHNVGRIVQSILAERFVRSGTVEGIWHAKPDFEAEIIEIPLGADKVILLRPTTFMNDSGRAVERFRAYYKIEPSDIIVLHDELDLPLGTVRTRLGGTSAGHNGVSSLINQLGTDQFWRVRIGVDGGQVSRLADTTKYVLDRFAAGAEWKVLELVVDETVAHLVEWLDTGMIETSFQVKLTTNN